MQLLNFDGQDDIRLHYVPLDETRGISLAFDLVRPVRLLGIISHGTESDHFATYSKISQPAIWVHCPLRHNSEQVSAIWLVQSCYVDWTMLIVSSIQHYKEAFVDDFRLKQQKSSHV